MKKEKITFWDFIHLTVRWRHKIILNCFAVSVIAAIISVVIPKTYIAHTTVLPSENGENMLGLSSLLGNLPIPKNGLGGISDFSGEKATYIAILNSRSVMDSAIVKFNLQKLYKKKTREDTRKQLVKNVDISLNDEGTITVGVAAKTKFMSFGSKDDFAKELSRDMANYFIARLDTVSRHLRGERARFNREFIEKRVHQNAKELAQAEESFKKFQKKSGLVALNEQTKALIETIAQLKGMVIAKQIEVQVLKNELESSHPKVIKAKMELEEYQKQYEKFIFANRKKQNESDHLDIFLPFDDIPDTGLEYGRLMRDVLLQQKIQEFIIPLYEQAKIQEAKDSPSVQIIDPAITPERKAKPKRAILVFLAFLIALIFNLVTVYIVANIEYLKKYDPEKHKKLNSIAKELKWKKIK